MDYNLGLEFFVLFFLFFVFSWGTLLWFDAVVFSKRECFCHCMSRGKVAITQNISYTNINVSLQSYFVSINSLSPSTEKKSSRQMLEFIILTFSAPHFSKDGVWYPSLSHGHCKAKSPLPKGGLILRLPQYFFTSFFTTL